MPKAKAKKTKKARRVAESLWQLLLWLCSLGSSLSPSFAIPSVSWKHDVLAHVPRVEGSPLAPSQERCLLGSEVL